MTSATSDIFLEIEDDGPTELVDRSTLERWTRCPVQAAMVERRLVADRSPEAESGNIVHDAISRATLHFYEGHQPSAGELADYIRQQITQSRPDLQRASLDAVAYSAYGIAANLLYQANGEPRSPEDIMAFDGGPEGARGQIAFDYAYKSKTFRLTCELDLMLATVSPEVVELWDYKSGHAVWNAEDVNESFQFGTFYPTLIMFNWPGVKVVRTRVYNTRSNHIAPVVEFRRDKHLPAAIARINSALDLREQYRAAELVKVPAWPKVSECTTCPAITRCPEANAEAVEVGSDPERAARQLIALEVRIERLKKALVAHVDEHGDIQANTMDWFGLGKPKSTKKPTADVYQLKEGGSK